MMFSELPKCCQDCMRLDNYLPWTKDDKVDYYCLAGVWLPVKKQSCKRQIRKSIGGGDDIQA